ncbi:LysM domain-containing protein [Desulfitobacterium dichloroeliminans LMG P-21439]|uniref:LysM domain-containing protein n=1 Tax=Desulfitobacterium dichloroeliminans (strain LMG P-21439 / DCA1) TaxID=871963 RepID=L0FD45_DESDL|nr:LysM domain-containing protein [Desulfitobacterium dichloroeliminans]AGA70556.1 LysM domain-containing protein [Desulfitobacterium dichloroeliminans LMG P-21439]
MKKTLAIILSASLVLSATALPAFAAVDTTTSSTIPAESAAPVAAPAAPKAPAATKAPAAAAPATMIKGDTYTVVSGDVLWRIAQKHNMTTDALIKLNPQLKNTNLIFPGDKIVVKATPAAAPAAPAVAAKKLYQGVGMVANYRDNSARGANNDNLNITTASVLFDDKGKIVELEWDVVEITPKMFPGWMDPAAEDKSFYKDAQTKGFPWETKREEGYAYDMTHLKAKGAADNLSKKEWFEQLDVYEELFKGMTVAEVNDWFAKYCGPDGRPYKMAYLDKLTDAQKAAIPATFTDAEKKMLVDVTTGATMALQDPHSRFIDALNKANDDQKEVKF